MSNQSSNRSGGIGFVGLLTITFIVLKLTHFISWSWLWVLAPIWLAPALWILMALAFLLCVTRSPR
jgi:hypothetical protein